MCVFVHMRTRVCECVCVSTTIPFILSSSTARAVYTQQIFTGIHIHATNLCIHNTTMNTLKHQPFSLSSYTASALYTQHIHTRVHIHPTTIRTASHTHHTYTHHTYTHRSTYTKHTYTPFCLSDPDPMHNKPFDSLQLAARSAYTQQIQTPFHMHTTNIPFHIHTTDIHTVSIV